MSEETAFRSLIRSSIRIGRCRTRIPIALAIAVPTAN